MIGVNFQPGSQGYGQQNGNGASAPPSGSGVQDAIKILSLRLPRVMGAQAAVPMPLLTAQGGGGRAESVVNQVLSRMLGRGMDTSGTMLPSQPMPFLDNLRKAPRVSIGETPEQPVRQSPAIDRAPVPYPFERGPERHPPSMDFTPRREAPSIDYAPPSVPPSAPPMPNLEALARLLGGGSGPDPFGQPMF